MLTARERMVRSRHSKVVELCFCWLHNAHLMLKILFVVVGKSCVVRCSTTGLETAASDVIVR